MKDKEKINLIRELIENAYETGSVDDAPYWVSLVNSIYTVLLFGEDNK